MHVLSPHVWEYGGSTDETAQVLAFARELGFPALDKLLHLFGNPSAGDKEIASYIGVLDRICRAFGVKSGRPGSADSLRAGTDCLD
jgi:hypothetical protein